MAGNRCVATCLAAALMCVAAMAVQVSRAAEPVRLEVGGVPPDDLGKTPEGEHVRISDHRGKVLVVSFWASWCPYCRKQFPALDFLQQQVDPSRLRVVVVNFEEDARTYRAVRRHARDAKVTWTHDRSGAIAGTYGVNSVPHTFIVDKAGRIADIRNGYSEDSFAEWVDLLNELLAEPAPAEADAAAAAHAAAGDAGAEMARLRALGGNDDDGPRT